MRVMIYYRKLPMMLGEIQVEYQDVFNKGKETAIWKLLETDIIVQILWYDSSQLQNALISGRILLHGLKSV